MLSPVRLPVVSSDLSSLTFVHPVTLLRRLEIFGSISTSVFLRWPSVDIQVKFYGDRPGRTPAPGELNTRGVAEYSRILIVICSV